MNSILPFFIIFFTYFPVSRAETKLHQTLSKSIAKLESNLGEIQVCSESDDEEEKVSAFDKRCNSLGHSLCKYQDNIKLYEFQKDDTYKKMVGEVEKKKTLNLSLIEELEKDLFKRMGMTSSDLQREFAQMRSKLQNLLPSTSGTVSNVQVYSLGEALRAIEKTSHSQKTKEELTKTLKAPCARGNSGVFANNAFIYTPIEGEVFKGQKQFVTYCPGVLLNALQVSKSKEKILDYFNFVIGHELTHVADSEKRPELHSKWSKCTSDRYALDDHTKKDQSLILKELSSDIGGTLLLASKLEGKKPEFVFSALSTTLTSAYCPKDLTDDTAILRLNLIGKHPKMMKLLGCPLPKIPSCLDN